MFGSLGAFLEGVKTFPEGVFWLLRHPRYLFLLFLPTAIGLTLFSFGSGWVVDNQALLMDKLYLDKPSEWWWLVLYYIGMAFVYLGIAITLVLAFFLVTNIIAAPIYDIVSSAVEKKVAPDDFEEISLWRSLLLIGEEVKKALFILAITVGLLIVPVVNVLAFPVAAFFLAWDFFDYPLARRGFSFRQRLAYATRHAPKLVGFGLWLSVPIVQFFIMPLAVAGGAMLGMRAIQQGNKDKGLH